MVRASQSVMARPMAVIGSGSDDPPPTPIARCADEPQWRGVDPRVLPGADQRAMAMASRRVEDWPMQVIVPGHATLGRAAARVVAERIVVGAGLLIAAMLLAYAVFGSGLLDALTPDGRATSRQLAVGALAWVFGLTAPAAFGIVGAARLASGFKAISLRRLPSTPAYRARRAIDADVVIARWVPLPDGSAEIPEVVIGPFGAAIIEELPPPETVVSRGPRSWEIQVANGRTHLIDQPLAHATRNADRVRIWFGGDDADHVVRVYAAVVGTDETVVRTPTCAVIRPEQVAAWLASLPTQRSFDEHRRERLIRLVRAAS